MQTLNDTGGGVTALAQACFRDDLDTLRCHTDRLFAKLMVIQWLAGIGLALFVLPQTGSGPTRLDPTHVWSALILGGAITSLPVFLAVKLPGHSLTRQIMAVAQVSFSALWIYLSGGRIETHFHVFGSLALLAIYRDWKVLLSATLVVAIGHFVRGWWPLSPFDILKPSPWRSLEHCGWVMFEDSFLIFSTRQSLREMYEAAICRTRLEATHSRVEIQAKVRGTGLSAPAAKLQGSEVQFASAFKYAAIGMALVSPTGRWLKANRALCVLLGYPPVELYRKSFQDITHPDDLEADLMQLQRTLAGEIQSYQMEKRYLHKAGQVVWVSLSVSLVWDAEGQPLHFISQLQSIDKRKEAEARLEIAHTQLLEVSRQAGMAEVATSVLHNVGNVLNSVNVSCAVVASRVRKSRIDRVAKIAALLHRHEEDFADFLTRDPTGKKLPEFLGKLAVQLSTEQAGVLGELQSLGRNIDHIKDIVAMQQNHAKVSGITEWVAVSDLVEHSLGINEESMRRHQVRVIREYDEVPRITVEKHRVLQILVNLIRNAKHASAHLAHADRHLTVGITRCADGVRVSVTDNGVGIPPENLTRIFAHGFTTKADGHGFGLHNSALAAREMGGSLTVHSQGAGTGATFTLELPNAGITHPQEPFPL